MDRDIDMEDYYKELREDMLTVWEDFSSEMEDFLGELQEENVEAYEEMYEEWKDFSEQMMNQKKNFGDIENYVSLADLFQRWVRASKDFRNVVQEKSGEDIPVADFDNIFSEYMENLRLLLGETIELGMERQRKEQEDLYDLWMDAWSSLGEEEGESIPDVVKDVQSEWIKSSTDLLKMWSESLEEGQAEDLFQKTQKEMLKNASNSMEELLSSEPYAMFQGSYLDNLLDTKITQKELLNTYLESFGVPTRDDILKVYESIHELTSRIRDLERRVDELSVEK